MNKIPENINLFELTSLLPGIYDIQKDISYKDNTYRLLFKIKDTDVGLFILTRCTNKRYFYYGENCNISLSVGDTIEYENNRPIIYILTIQGGSAPLSGKYTADKIEKELVDNILFHLNHEKFKEHFNINSEIIYNNYITSERKRKIELIKLRRILEQTKDFSIFNNNFLNIKQ